MCIEARRIAGLEQALYAALSAAEQYGISAEDLRLMAIGGLSLNSSWLWVDDHTTDDATTELTNAVGVVRAGNQ
ncbi:hypothetical protein C1S65_16480 [Pseudomonas putida]|uniref:Uncharacterized protein n=1 Tax=Pseudomonas putida TaxID=303 RepID=A0AAD0L6Y6_PSEPU|nr:hypothetical protein C1S65_16480 [Pseudomonas putida]